MKVLKGIFFFLMGLIMIGCTGILVCALNPSLTAMLAERVESVGSAQSSRDGQSGGLGGLFRDGDGQSDSTVPGEGQPGINADWLEGQSGYEQPDSPSVEAPEDVSGRTGYEPVQEEAQEIDEDEAGGLTGAENPGDTGSGLSFDAETYPYYAMLEAEMQQIYSQIYANAMSLTPSFTPVATVSVSQLKTVFEAVYNDHPELFWLDTGYSCKYLRSGRCAEITLKFNETADALEQARLAFQGAAGNIVAQARGLGSQAEMERYVHDALMGLVEYDVAAPMNQSAYSALVGGRSVCAGYARAFQYIMQELGVPCYYCTGYAGEDHAWNIVKIDGVYQNVDVTWDDTEEPTYNYFNKTDRELAATHRRTGLSVYLPACEGAGTQTPAAPEGGEAGTSEDGEIPGSAENPGGEDADGADDISGLINPNPIKPLEWESKREEVPVDPLQAAEDRRRESLEKAGVTEEQVRDTMQEYYEDCRRLLKDAGTGDRQFVNVIPQSLWGSVERAYNSGDYRKGYVDSALKDMGASSFAIQLQVQDLGGGYYRLYHNVYTY
ncbi:transglutaminase domain-containing protein [uncultured Acetatifactor sp.]|uniref:transglutaminase domain-containing protein n=1 Tax=uncultured Acetatifactor sp. TaxID=1671927 RepID=UPI0026182875|nr:transglutaminase domain-containing protein [uncultured Acetatifactor sp.]